MREFVKVEVKEIFELYSTLERDIAELIQTNRIVMEDRDYSSSVKSSISKEIQKLEDIKQKLLNLEVDVPKNLYIKELESELKNHSTKTIPEKSKEVNQLEKKKIRY
jgi:hypothetical protein